MKILRQIGIVLIIVLLGELLSNTLKLPIPGNICGMIILLLLLSLKII